MNWDKDSEPNIFIDMAWVYTPRLLEHKESELPAGFLMVPFHPEGQYVPAFRTAIAALTWASQFAPGLCEAIRVAPNDLSLIAVAMDAGGICMRCDDGEWKLWHVSQGNPKAEHGWTAKYNPITGESEVCDASEIPAIEDIELEGYGKQPYVGIQATLMAMLKEAGLLKPEAYACEVRHDDDCPYHDDKLCSCDPTITVRKGDPDGPTVAKYFEGKYMLVPGAARMEVG